MRRLLRDEAGAATMLAAVGSLLILMVTAVVTHLGAAVLARDRAELAADVAALAGAARVLGGAESACAAATRVATANHVALDSCTLDGADVLIRISAAAGPLGVRATARARAGPVAAQISE